MNDFFTELEAELGTLTRDGIHLADADARGRRRRLTVLLRRGIAIIAVAMALAASLDSEFPATAHGYALAAISAAPQA